MLKRSDILSVKALQPDDQSHVAILVLPKQAIRLSLSGQLVGVGGGVGVQVVHGDRAWC